MIPTIDDAIKHLVYRMELFKEEDSTEYFCGAIDMLAMIYNIQLSRIRQMYIDRKTAMKIAATM